jgi:protein ImuB
MVVHVAIARTQMAVVALALSRPGITVVEPGSEAAALAPVPIDVLDVIYQQGSPNAQGSGDSASSAVSTLKHWGLKRLGELAALPSADLAARLGQQGLAWQAIARGEDGHPLVPTLLEERFDASLELEWPIEGLEPLSFVLTRLLEPLSTRLERRDRGAAVLHTRLRLVTKAIYARSLELPAPLRDVRTLRTLALLDLESHPPPAAIDAVTVVIDPTPGRVLQHSLFNRANPAPDEISTLLARLAALMGAGRIGVPSIIDTYRPGAFEMKPFTVSPDRHRRDAGRNREEMRSRHPQDAALFGMRSFPSALRRFRQPVAARVAVLDGRPVRVTTDRRGLTGGSVVACAGPWRTSGHWWADGPCGAGGDEAPAPGRTGGEGRAPVQKGSAGGQTSWDRAEWDVALSDGGVYRVFRDCEAGGWFIDAIVD